MARQQYNQLKKLPERDNGMPGDDGYVLPANQPPSTASEDAGNALDSIDQTLADNEAAMASARRSLEADDINSEEGEAPDSPQSTEAEEQESGAVGADKQEDEDPKESGLYAGSGKKKAWLSRKKEGLAASLVTLVVVGGFGITTILSGPAQLLQLDAILGKNEKAHTLVVKNRIGRMLFRSLFRHADDRLLVSRSRLGVVHQRVFGGMLNRLESQHGIRFIETTGPLTGRTRPNAVIDPPASSQLRGRTPTQTRLNIAREFGIDASKVNVSAIGSANATFSINQLDLNSAELTKFKTVMAARAGGGSISKLNPKVAVAINKRLFSKVLRLPSLFHPITRASEAAGRGIDNSVQARRARKQTDAERSRRSTETKQRTTEARSTLKGKVGTNVMKTAGAAIALQGVMCMVKDIAGIVPGIYYSTVVLPAMIRSIQAQSVASQLESGKDFKQNQMGDVLADLSDAEGRNVWGAKSMNALSRGGAGNGTDIDVGAKAAFTTTGSSIGGLTAALGYDEVAGTDVSDSVAAWACSPLARVGGLVVGVAVTVGGVAGGVFTGGTTTAGAVGRVAVQAALAGSIFYAASRILGEFVDGNVRGKISDACGVEFDSGEGDKPEDIEVLNAEAYGNCLAYSSRMSSNINHAVMGGVPIDKSEETILVNKANEYETAEFKEKSLFTRLFSLQEERSLATSILRPSVESGLYTGNFASIAAGLLNIPSSLTTGLFSVLSPSVGAQATTYDWGFPLVSLPTHIIENPDYSDPIENANWIANNRSKVDDDRIKKCFGVEISSAGSQLQTIPLDKEINPLSDDYNNANCGDLSQPSWIRTALFVADDAIARAMYCHEGDEESCRQIGIGNKVSTPPAVSGLACPTDLGTSLTSPNGSKTIYQIKQPAGNEYIVRSGAPQQQYGIKELLCVLHTAGVAYNKAMGGDSKLEIWDLAAGDPHVSHVFTVGVDLRATGKKVAGDHSNDGGKYDAAATIELGKAFVNTGKIKSIWWCEPGADNKDLSGSDGSMNAIRDYASSIGKPVDIKCLTGHANHFHIDIVGPKNPIYCPPGDVFGKTYTTTDGGFNARKGEACDGWR